MCCRQLALQCCRKLELVLEQLSKTERLIEVNHAGVLLQIFPFPGVQISQPWSLLTVFTGRLKLFLALHVEHVEFEQVHLLNTAVANCLFLVVSLVPEAVATYHPFLFP